MNTANKLTMARVFLIPVFLILLYLDFPYSRFLALIVFVIASVTDFIDGYIARHYNQVTDFGKFMDPLADKLLVMSAMLWFVETGTMPSWALLIVIAREFSVTALRLIAVDQGKVIAAGRSGKVKTAATMVCVCLMLLPFPLLLSHICVAVILITTVYSGLDYFYVNRAVFHGGSR
ncbi:MAG: CDP-diacylglycerol--glycerol-3-phosphate 3-phosphatidyltransferase [Evtepia sp.]